MSFVWLSILTTLTLSECVGRPLYQEADKQSSAKPIPARVDERVELLSIVFRLAKAGEYAQAPKDAAYVKAVDEYFGPFREHAAIKLAKKLRERHGIGFDAVASFAVSIRGGPKLEVKLPFDHSDSNLDKRWPASDAKEFLTTLQSFADDSKAFEFFARHRDLYERSAERLAREVAKRPYRAWLEDYFGVNAQGAEFCAIVGMLNGGANYGMKFRYPDGHEEILPILGAGEYDVEGIVKFDSKAATLVAHEFCHSYCNPLIDKFSEKLLPSGEKIFPQREKLMRPQAYGTARTMLYESLVRACTHRFLVKHGTPREADHQLREEVGRGFFWTPELSRLLAEYERSRDQHKSLADFMPRIVTYFEKLAASLDERMAKFPRVAKMTPANGAVDVDPALMELVIEFDRPMARTGRAIVGNPSNMPTFEKGGGYDADGKTFRLRMQLQPGKTYRYSLNGINFTGFVSTEGIPLDPVSVTFTTRKE